jgi:hypothetical protein
MTSDELPPPAPHARPRRSSHPDRDGGPNYLVRRAAAVAALLAVIGVAAAVTLAVTRDDGDAADDGTGWNGVAVVDTATGAIALLDADGAETGTVAGTGRVVDVHALADRVALVGTDQITVVDVGDAQIAHEIPFATGASVERLPTARALVLVVTAAAGATMTFVDAVSGEMIDVADVADLTNPLLVADSLRSSIDGTAFAVGDGRTFQTVVVRFGDEVATYFPGVPMAVSDELVVTSQNVGSSAELGFFDVTGERIGTVEGERPIGGTVDGERFVHVTATGSLFVATPDDDVEKIGSITVPDGDGVRWARPVADGAGLLVAGDQFEALVDVATGEVRYQTTFAAPVDVLEPDTTWRCVAIGGSGSYDTLVDAATGAVLADLARGDVMGTSADGCGVDLLQSGARRIVTPDDELVVPASSRSIALSPDGRTAAVVAVDGTGALRPVDGADPTDLGTVDGTPVFVLR